MCLQMGLWKLETGARSDWKRQLQHFALFFFVFFPQKTAYVLDLSSHKTPATAFFELYKKSLI